MYFFRLKSATKTRTTRRNQIHATTKRKIPPKQIKVNKNQNAVNNRQILRPISHHPKAAAKVTAAAMKNDLKSVKIWTNRTKSRNKTNRKVVDCWQNPRRTILALDPKFDTNGEAKPSSNPNAGFRHTVTSFTRNEREWPRRVCRPMGR